MEDQVPGLKSAVSKSVGDAANKVGPEVAELKEETKDAQPLSLVLGTIQSSSSDDAGVDEIRQLAGLGVLLRQSEDPFARMPSFKGQPWRCLTLGSTLAWDGATSEEVQPVGVVPWRVVVQAGLETRTVSYSDDPLTARGLRHLLSVEMPGPPPETPTWISFDQLLFDGTHKDAWRRLPCLKFGQHYQVSAFKIAAAGAMPPELCVDGMPLTLDLKKLEELETAPPLTELRYQRRTPVAAPRLVGKEDEATLYTPLTPPTIPEGMVPRAIDIGATRIGRNVDDDSAERWSC